MSPGKFDAQMPAFAFTGHYHSFSCCSFSKCKLHLKHARSYMKHKQQQRLRKWCPIAVGFPCWNTALHRSNAHVKAEELPGKPDTFQALPPCRYRAAKISQFTADFSKIQFFGLFHLTFTHCCNRCVRTAECFCPNNLTPQPASEQLASSTLPESFECV